MTFFLRALLSSTVGVALVAGGAGATYAAAPSNDTPAGARVITSLPTTIDENTTQATTDALDASLNAQCGAPATNASVWFTYTATTGDGFTATMADSDYTGGFMVTEGDPSGGNLVACSPTTVGVRTTPGQTYYVVAFSDSAVNGGHLKVTFDKAPPPPELSLTTGPRGVAYKDGSARVHGTYTCTNDEGTDSEFDGTLTQRVGRFKIVGSFSVYPLECDGAAHAWSALVTSDNGLFRGGRARVSSHGSACGPLDCTEAESTRTIKLNRRR